MLSKRSFTNFTEFPGKLINGIHTFPQLLYIDTNNNTRQWQIYVRLVTDQNRQTTYNFDLNEEKQIDISANHYVDTDLLDGVIAQTYVMSGVTSGTITLSAPTYFDTVAFIGQANQRSPFQQALISARALYLKKLERTQGEQVTTSHKEVYITDKKYFPMLASTYKIGAKHLVYPLYIQCKLDGVRCICYLSKPNTSWHNVVLYSRSQKDFPSLDYLKQVLYVYLNDLYDVEKGQSIYLDGEIYKHGKRLQDISGEARNASNTVKNQYHLYDCFYPLELNTKFSQRHKQLQQLFLVMKENNDTAARAVIKYVKTTLVHDVKTVNKLFDTFIANGYEGAILRNVNAIYISSATSANTRSKQLVKMKNKFTDEFIIIGFTQGTKGKDVGAIIWIVKTVDNHEFTVTPKDMTYAERKALYAECLLSFDSKYLDKQLTVEYEDMSANGIPLRAKAVAVRDYE